MTSRRRMMMQQMAQGFELVYDANSGLLPTKCGWDRFAVPWNNNFGLGTQSLENGFLKLHNGHMYEHQGYYPIDHFVADNCSITVIFVTTTTCDVCIHLTDGTLSAMGAITSNSRFECKSSYANRNRQISVGVTLGATNTFTAIKKGSIAEYWLNGNLIYTQTQLFSVDVVSTGLAGAISTPDHSGYITEVRNAAALGYNGDVYVSKVIYREW